MQTAYKHLLKGCLEKHFPIALIHLPRAGWRDYLETQGGLTIMLDSAFSTSAFFRLRRRLILYDYRQNLLQTNEIMFVEQKGFSVVN
jgi:hypothetical protein